MCGDCYKQGTRSIPYSVAFHSCMNCEDIYCAFPKVLRICTGYIVYLHYFLYSQAIYFCPQLTILNANPFPTTQLCTENFSFILENALLRVKVIYVEICEWLVLLYTGGIWFLILHVTLHTLFPNVWSDTYLCKCAANKYLYTSARECGTWQWYPSYFGAILSKCNFCFRSRNRTRSRGIIDNRSSEVITQFSKYRTGFFS